MTKKTDINIDLYDKKLLYELDRDSSINLSDLSKKLKRSKQFILYRIKKLEELKIVTGYHAIVDMSKLGFFTFRVYFKFQQMTDKEGDQFIQFVQKKLEQVWTITSMHGKWDYALFLGVKDISEFHKIWGEIMLLYKKNIKTYNVAVYAPIYNFNRNFFLDNNTEPVTRIYGDGKLTTIDKLDWKLIELYANNVRQSALEMSKKLNVAPDTIRARINKLVKSNIIVGYKIGLNLEKLNYVGYRLDLQLNSTERNKEIFEYCKHHKNIYQINKSIGGADFEMEVIVENLNHLIKLIDELKTHFKSIINDVEYFGFTTFHILKYIPD
tara:strand:- start:1417 stop:2391 length:975 start_codon:yes stop_codon:yes gene_type:complete